MDDSQTDDDVVEYEPDFSLKKKIGIDININEVINKTSITDGQKVINSSQKDFLRWVENDIQTLENVYAEILNDRENKELPETLKMTAFSIKAQAGTFNFALGSAVAKSLYDFMENQFSDDPNHLIIIRKHIDTLRSIFHHNIVSDGGQIGNAVYSDLGALINKFTK